MIDLLKLLLGQRSLVGAAGVLVAGYLGLDPNDPWLMQLLKGAATGGAACLAIFAYWSAIGPKAVLLKLAAGAMPITYAILGYLAPPDMDNESKARVAELVAGLAGALITWSGVQPNTLTRPANPKLANRNLARLAISDDRAQRP